MVEIHSCSQRHPAHPYFSVTDVSENDTCSKRRPAHASTQARLHLNIENACAETCCSIGLLRMGNTPYERSCTQVKSTCLFNENPLAAGLFLVYGFLVDLLFLQNSSWSNTSPLASASSRALLIAIIDGLLLLLLRPSNKAVSATRTERKGHLPAAYPRCSQHLGAFQMLWVTYALNCSQLHPRSQIAASGKRRT